MDLERRCKTFPSILVLGILWALDSCTNQTTHFLITLGTDPESSALDNVELMVKYRLSNCPDVILDEAADLRL